MEVSEIRLMRESMSRRELAKKVSGTEVGWEDGRVCGRWTRDAQSLEAADMGCRRRSEQLSGYLVGVPYIEQQDGAALSPTCCQAMTSKGTDCRQAPWVWAGSQRGENQELVIPGGVGRRQPELLARPVQLRVPTLLILSEGKIQIAPMDGRTGTHKWKHEQQTQQTDIQGLMRQTGDFKRTAITLFPSALSCLTLFPSNWFCSTLFHYNLDTVQLGTSVLFKPMSPW